MQGKTSSLRDFDVLSKLGEGAFGQVFKVKRKADGKEYALKKVKIGSMKEKERDNALNEIRILASYNEEYIIGYKEAFYDENSFSLCVVMEFASGGDILKQNQVHLKKRTKYKEDEIWKALVHMTKGLKSLHDRKILHRDLKCANVFITAEGVFKLGDLNVSKVLKKDMAFTQTGTPYYASPQVWKDKPYGLKSDMWSLGCVLYEMAALRPPFVASDLQTLYKKVCAGIFQRIPMIYSSELANVISSLLKVDPDKRPTTEDLLASNIVRKHFGGEFQPEEAVEDDFDQLLKTIKYNPKDLKGLKNILPKANYQEDINQKEKLNLQDMKGGIQSCKNARKQPNIKEQLKNSIESNERKLAQFLEKKKILEEKERERHMKIMLDQQKEELIKKRERVLSACGLRPAQNLYQSPNPKIAVVDKNEMGLKNNQIKNYHAKKEDSTPKLPPKPQGGQNINYRLPPKKPVLCQYEQNSKPEPKVESKKSVEISNPNPKPPTALSGRSNRSSSVQRIIYPSWWG